jgi:hypothetical protein
MTGVGAPTRRCSPVLTVAGGKRSNRESEKDRASVADREIVG